ncbi:hypothetical protein EMCRGX_G006918 [Ephydatia muelleri]
MYRQSRLSVKRKNETRKPEPTPLTVSIDISYWKNVRVTHLKQQLSLTSVVEPVFPPGWLKVLGSGKKLMSSQSVFSLIPQSMSSIADVKTLLCCVDGCKFCCGNDDDVTYIMSNYGRIMNASGTECVAYLDIIHSTIRHAECELLVIPDENSGQRCHRCTPYRSNLWALLSRHVNHDTDASRTDPNSHASFSRLSSPEKYYAGQMLRQCVKPIDLVPLDVCSGRCQMQAAFLNDALQMRWDPVMVRWCLYLRHLSSSAYEMNLSTVAKLPSCMERDKCVIIIFDETHLHQDLTFDKHTGDLTGFVHIRDMNNHLSQRLFTNLRFPSAHWQFPCTELSGDQRFLLHCNGMDISWDHLYTKNRLQGDDAGLSLVPKLKYEHVHLTSYSKMRVDLAAQVLSNSRLTEVFLMYLDEWEESVKGREGFNKSQRSMMLLSAETRQGLSLTGVLVFLSNRVCQDPLEKFFGQQRQRSRAHENPSVSEFIRKQYASLANLSAPKEQGNVCEEGPQGSTGNVKTPVENLTRTPSPVPEENTRGLTSMGSKHEYFPAGVSALPQIRFPVREALEGGDGKGLTAYMESFGTEADSIAACPGFPVGA